MDARRATKGRAATRRRVSSPVAASPTGATAASERVIYVTPGYRLHRARREDRRAGLDFGKDGVVDLKLEDDQAMDPVNGEVGLHAAPVVAGNTVIIGAAHTWRAACRRSMTEREGLRPRLRRARPESGSGSSTPSRSAASYGNDTWEKDSWSYTGNARRVGARCRSTKSSASCTCPSRCRPATTTAAIGRATTCSAKASSRVDLKTGQRKWHYQLVHHGIWDFDIPCAPILADITVNGQRIKALAQPTKQAMLYMFDRATGKPICPIEERAVEKGDVPGEWYAPTQPVPLNGRGQPFAYDWNGFSARLHHRLHPARCARKASASSRATRSVPSSRLQSSARSMDHSARSASRSTAAARCGPAARARPRHAHHVRVFTSQPGVAGHDQARRPEGQRHELRVGQRNHRRALDQPDGAAPGRPSVIIARGAPVPDNGADGSEVARAEPRAAGGGGGEGGPAITVQGLPIVKPPYGSISAISLDSGEVLWQIAARRHAGQRSQSCRAERRDHPAHGPGRHHRHARDQDVADRRRGDGDNRGPSRGRVAAGLRQSDAARMRARS